MTGLKIQIGNVGNSGPADHAAGKQIFLIFIFGSLDAVGGHQNGAGKIGEFFDLFLPGRSELTVEMLILLQLGIAMGWRAFLRAYRC